MRFYNFYQSLIKSYSDLTSFFIDFIKKDQKWRFGTLKKAVFAAMKAKFKLGCIIVIYNIEKLSIMESNASDKAMSAVLSQPEEDGKFRPVVIFSKKFSPIKLNYEIYDKELFAIIKTLKKWRYYLKGAKY